MLGLCVLPLRQWRDALTRRDGDIKVVIDFEASVSSYTGPP